MLVKPRSILLYLILHVCVLIHAHYPVANIYSASDLSDDISANDDYLLAYHSKTSVIEVLSNDFGFEGNNATLTITVQPLHGTLKILSNNSIEYTPTALYLGPDEITYSICSNGECDEAIVSIDVVEFDYQPELVDDHVVVIANKYQKIDVMVNDLNLYDLPITLAVVEEPANGECIVTSDLQLEPHFTPGFLGADQMTYEVIDAEGDRDTATVIFDVTYEENTSYTIPSGISPNGDGKNDYFRVPDFYYYKSLSIKILNRIGEVVYEISDYDNSWDGRGNQGRYNGQILPVGVYYYFITIHDIGKDVNGYIYLNK